MRRKTIRILTIAGVLLLAAAAVFATISHNYRQETPPEASVSAFISPTPERTVSTPAPTPSPTPTLTPTPSPTPSPTPTPYVPDWAWLGAEKAGYAYSIYWDAYEFDEDRPLELLRVTVMPEEDRQRMLDIIAQWASLYPPQLFNRVIGRVLCYRAIDVPMLDDNDQMLYDASGNLRYETIYGATSRSTIIITDRFANDEAILRALVHEMAHLEWNRSAMREQNRLLEEIFREINGDFVYWFEREGIMSTSDIPDWRSSDGAADWRGGWARRYGSLSFDEDLATVTEKLVMGKMEEFADYPELYAKMQAVIAWRSAMHPDQTETFYQQVLPEFLAGRE